MHIALDQLTKSFGSIVALDAISLAIDPGQIVVLLGPNGAGKTTLMRCLAAIAAPDGGEIRYDEETFRRDRIDLRRRLFFMPDFPYVFPEMNVIRHIGMVLDLYECDRDHLADDVISLLDEFDILALSDCPIGTLSRGQSYKAALTALIAADPEVWILDEPFASGMDPRGLAAFRRRCRQATERGRTVIYSTQIVDVVDDFADRVCVIENGRLTDFPTVAAFHAELDRPESPLAPMLGATEGGAA